MYESKDIEVSYPNHYKGVYGTEVLDAIRNFTANLKGMEAVDTANAIKDILRLKKKGGKQDVEREIYYLTDLLDLLVDKQIKGQITGESIDLPIKSRDLFISKEDVPTYSIKIGDMK